MRLNVATAPNKPAQYVVGLKLPLPPFFVGLTITKQYTLSLLFQLNAVNKAVHN